MIVVPKGSEQYPALAYLMSAWFHQDWDIYGEALEQILPHYVAVTPQEERAAVIADIARFEQEHGRTDAVLTASFEAVFDPEVFVEGWEGMTTRQWLHRVAELIR